MKRNKKISFRFLIALYIGKLVQIIIKLIYKDKGTHLPGKWSIKICPDFLSRIGRPDKIIAITGTNGKTSVSHFINTILINNGFTTINNNKGSNAPAGIASALIEVADLLGRVKKDVAVLEVDERSSGFIYYHILPHYLICTNLFRDSIKRNGHSEFILTKIKSSVPKTTTLVLNADDLISSNIGTEENKKVYFSVEKLPTDREFDNIVRDIVVCPQCKSKLKYKYRHYHHIGKTYCSNCDFKSPKSDFIVTDVNFKNKLLTLKERGKEIKYKLFSDSIFNIYNIVATIALVRTFGLSHEQIKKAFDVLAVKKDRINNDFIKSKEIITMLAKDQNPISCSRIFDYVSNQPGNKVIILYITDVKDKVNGSEDISWLYDTDFEYLNNNEIKQIIACGTRCYDILLRLKLAGIKEDIIKVSDNYDKVEELVTFEDIDKIYILYALYAYPLAVRLKKKIIERLGD